MKQTWSPSTHRWLGTAAAAAALLLSACGGGDSTTAGTNAGQTPSEQAASVQITETASGLTVKSTLASASSPSAAAASAPGRDNNDSGRDGTSVTQTAQFTVSATSADKTAVLQGQLALRAETEGSGVAELKGRFVATAAPAASAPAAAPSAEALAAFDAAKASLKATLRAAVDQARAALDAAVAADPASKATARAKFRADVAAAVNAFRAELAKAAAAAGITLGGRDNGRAAARGIEVEGSFDAAAKKVTLEVQRRGELGTLVLTGTGTLETGFAGTFSTTLNGAAVTGEWSAAPAGATAPTVPLPAPTPPVPGACASQTVTWSIGTANCSASFAGGASGASASLANSLAGSTGSVTASCNNGVVTTANPVCTVTAPTPVTPAPAGDVAAGLALYNGKCAGCHGSSKANASAAKTATGLAAVMQSVASHAGVGPTLSAQDRLDLAAYIASTK